MKLRKSVIALSLLAGSTALMAAPQYRLVSGDRGVILSVDNIQAEPEVVVELIDGNLSVRIQDETLDSTYANTMIFPEGFWADSLVESYDAGSAKLLFYNFGLSIEDMQKKYGSERLLLLVSPGKSQKYDSRLFKVGAKATVESVTATDRDGLEFITLSGANLAGSKVSRNENGVVVTMPEGFKVKEKSFVLPKEFLVDSLAFAASGSGLPSYQFFYNDDDGYLSLMNAKDENLTLTFVDNREKEVELASHWSSTEKLVSFKLDPTIGKNSVEESPAVEETPVAQENPVAVEEPVVQERVVEKPAVEEPKVDPNAGKVLFLTKNDVNIRRSPETSSKSNIIGKYPLGTRMVSKSKKGSWFNVSLEDGTDAWVYSTLVGDSASITDDQWDAIYNSRSSKDEGPVVDEFNSPGNDPLLADNKKDVFKLDSTKVEPAENKNNGLKEPELTEKTEVVIKPYKKYGRDPFLPLTTSDFLKPKMPKLDNLSLVGIIYDPTSSLALFEEIVDGEIKSKSMKAGERIENGKLLRIYENKVVFLMFESDISFTVEKELLDKKE